MAGRKISGIYVPIGLDTQRIQQDMDTLQNQLTNITRNISQSLDAAISPQKMADGLGRLTNALGNVRDASKALQALRPFGYFEQALRSNITIEPLRDLAKTLGITEEAQRKLLQTMGKNTAINQQVNGLRQLERVMGTTRKETLELANSLGLLIDRQTKAQYLGSQGRGILGAFTPSNMTAGLQSAMGAMGVVGGAYGVVELGKSMTKAALQMENIRLGFESIYGSAGLAASKLEYVKKVSNELGLSFVNTAEGAKKMFAAAKGTEVEADVENIFYSFSTMGAALKLSGDQMNSVFLALSQSISKGKLSAEEMRQQLAERMPGAIQLLAKSMGKTTQELDKMFQDGTVGLKNLVGFAEEVRRTYESGARAASTGLQAELNRVSTAWFELKAAFVDTDATADMVRNLGSALTFLAENADTISKVVKELGKFALLTGGIYAAITAIRKLTLSVSALWGAIKAGSFTSFLASFGPAGVGIGAASAAIGGLVYGLMSLADTSSESDRRIEKMSGQFFDLERSIRDVSGATDDLQQKQADLEMKSLENKVKDAINAFQGMFEHTEKFADFSDSIADGFEGITFEIQENALDKLFSDLTKELQNKGRVELGATFEVQARELSEKFLNGVKANLSKEKISALYLDLTNSFESLRGKILNISGNEKAISAYESLKNALVAIAKTLLDAKSAQLEYNQSQAETTKILEQSNASYQAIKKLAAASDVGKENKIAEGMRTVASELVNLYKIAGEAKEGMENLDLSLEDSGKKALDFRQEIQNFESVLPLVASLAIKNGTDFETMAAGLEQAAIQAGRTQEQILELKAALNAAFNIEIGKSIEKSLQQLDTKIALAGAKTAQTTAYNILSTGVTDEATKTKLATAAAKGNVKELKEIYSELGRDIALVDQVWEKSAIFGASKGASRGGGGRSRASRAISETRKQTIDFAKEIGDVQKKIAALQSKIDDDPSVKFLADVEGELKKIKSILDSGLGTAKEREELENLSKEYKQFADMRAKQMADEERRQKAIEAASRFGKGWGNLGDVSGAVNPELQVGALKAQYEQEKEAFDKMLNDKIVSQEIYNQHIADLQEELRVKTEASEGGMVANFTDKLNQSYEKIQDWQSTVSDIMMTGINSMSDAFANFFITNINDTKSLQEAFSNMVQSMIKSLAQLFMQMMIVATLKKVMGFFGGGGADYSPAQNATMSANGMQSGYGGWLTGVHGHANGGIFSGGGSISRYTNSIVTRPTLFSYGAIKPFGRGGGIMGERGWEAVMPLVRNSQGKLSVNAVGSGSPAVDMNQVINVNVINSTDSKVTTQKSRDNNGNVDIKIMIEKMVGEAMRRPGSAPANALRDVYGAQIALADR